MDRCGGAPDFVRACTRLALALALVAACVGISNAPASADITYVYDELGRLVGVVDPASDTAVYSYDAVGNLLGIARSASTSVSIIDFQPTSGPVGTVVTIQGTGFSATPANNAVAFNGTSATATASTATSLTVPVPAGATTGPIGVTTPAGSATSSRSFTVTATNGVPTISSLSPTIGLPGAPVTVSGGNFETTTTNNNLSFYGAPRAKAVVSAASSTSLDAVVPAKARSGPIMLSTPGGTAASAPDFFVPTGTYTAAQVAFTGRIAVGGASVQVPLTSSNKLALVVFDGVAGQRLDLGTVLVSGFGTPVVTVYRPDGVQLPITASSSARYLSPLPMSGVYTIAMENVSASHTIRLTLSDEITATATVGGSSLDVSVAREGQRARVSFAGAAGQRVSLGFTDTIGSATLYFKTADETTLAAIGIGTSGELHSPALPSTGTYLLVVEPGPAYTGSFTATLSDEVTGSITIDGSSLTLTGAGTEHNQIKKAAEQRRRQNK